MHGYEFATRIALCCDARTTDAMIYPMLKELESGGYVELELAVINGRNHKIYSLSRTRSSGLHSVSSGVDQCIAAT